MTGPVLVLGDIMLDVNFEAPHGRLSPEAPVVVMANPAATYALGGSANTAANVTALGLPSVVLGIVGDDDAGSRCSAMLGEHGIIDACISSQAHKTTVKTRYRVSGQQLLRIDVEETEVSAEDAQRIAARVRETIDGASALIISDYAKGVVTPAIARSVIEMARNGEVPVIVDSKKTDLSCFAHATAIAPNHHEALAATGHADASLAARAIAASTLGGVVVTLGVGGMLVDDAGTQTHIPSQAREVADVTGAGDTVTAALAVALAEGAELVDAARWATAAAAVAVAHRGTFAVPRHAVVVE